MFELELETPPNILPVIKVIGVGGGGCNAINNLINSGLNGVELIAANTDAQTLDNSLATHKIQLGMNKTKGRGAGGDPNVGRESALEEEEKIREILKDTEMVFIAAGLGGGTGTGATPVIAEISKGLGALTIAVVTKPFSFEGSQRLRAAEDGIEELKGVVDTLIAIPNQKLLSISTRTTSLIDAFKKADEVLLHAVKGISSLILTPGLINRDFADVKRVMSEMGLAFMGIGSSAGENRAIEAAHRAITSPLLEDISIDGARSILINITGGTNLTLFEVNEASSLVKEKAHNDANIIFGTAIDERLEEEVIITIIATGLLGAEEEETGTIKEMTENLLPFTQKSELDDDVPAFLRKGKGSLSNSRVRLEDILKSEYGPEKTEEDIPAFLRKRGK